MEVTIFNPRHIGKKIFAAISLLLCTITSDAQVFGTKIIGVDYPTLAAAITDLNTVGVSSAVVINIPAGYTETAPSGGYLLGSTVLNGSTSAANTLTFQKSGTGADPVLVAQVGTSITNDGIFIISGTDYVTLNGVSLEESGLNTTATTRMEWGYALVKLQNTAPFDGCQNVTIQNCTVTLNRANANTVGIYANNHTATATTALTITASTDAMNNCTFKNNTIQNTVTGIMLRGFAAATPYTLYDQNNLVGGSSGDGNTLQNFSGATIGYGVNLQYQNGANVSYNTINNTAGAGTAATAAIYGIYAQSGINVSVGITNNNISLAQGTTTGAMYGVNASCSGTGTVNINSNTFTATGGSSGSMYMIYIGGANTNINTNSNTFYNINVATTGSLYFVYHNTASGLENITCNNNVTAGPATPYVRKTGAGGTVAGYYNNAGVTNGFAQFNNNDLSYINLAGSPTFYGLFENDGGTGQNKFARNNVISNITSAGGTLYGLWMGYSATECFSDNKVFLLNAGAGTIYGIYVNTNSSIDSVVNNSVHDLTSTGGNLYGIYITAGTTVNAYLDTVYSLSTTGAAGLAYGIFQNGGTTVNIFRNKIYDIASAGTNGTANGLSLASGTVTAYNNLIGDIRTPNLNSTTGSQLAGINLGAGTAFNIYFNTVFINGSSAGTNFSSSAIYSSTTPILTLRNNIFINTSTAKGTGLTVAYRRNGGTLTTYQNASNNNIFYAGASGASNLIFYDGTLLVPSIASYKSFIAPRDANSGSENTAFISTAGTSPQFLHISFSSATQAESGGINIAGITTDVDGNIRAGNTGYAGVGSAPDIGATEGNYIIADLSAPVITYAPLSSGCSTGDRTFTVTISDASGVPTTGTFVPRVYFLKGTGGYVSSPGTLISGAPTNGVWSFTISAAALGGLAIGDVVSYFVIAQDIVATPNVSANPGISLVATNVNTIFTYPAPPNSYTIIPVLSGTYNIGVGQPYTTITSAVNDYNTSCISGNVIFQLTDAAYPGETFPITINSNGSADALNTLTIKPATGVTTNISGSSATSLFILNGSDYVTIEGSNNPTANSICPAVAAARNLTITNTSTGTSSAVVWIQSTTTGDSATHNTVRNTNLVGSGNTFTLFGIGSGGASISYTSMGRNNNSNRIENNKITATQTGIYSMGASAANKNYGTVINQNHMDAVAPDNQRNNGILVGYEDGVLISGNSLANINNSITNDIVGINVGFGNNSSSTTSTTGNEVTNAIITYNKLDNITQTNTYSCIGISVAGATSGINTIANNMISGVLSNGTGGDFSSGIFIGGAAGGTTRLYFNAVSMSGTLSGASYPCYAISVSGSNPILDLKNNLFVNNAVTGSSLIYAIGLAYSTYSNLSSNNNNFFSVGANIGTIGTLAGTGTNLAMLADWQTTTGKDALSKQVDPDFIAPSDLHLTLSTVNIPLMDAGVPVAVATDYDCMARGTSPDLGINEFNIPLCSSVTAGTAVPDTAVFCNSGSTAINILGATVGVGIRYQWQSSADSVTWIPIAGATSNTYITPVITATTYYRVVLNCFYSGAADSASTKVTINPLPVITVTPNGGAICSSGTGLDMTASGADTYTWLPIAGLSTPSGPTVNANPSATTVYTVTGTDLNGCINSHASTVSVTSAPAPITAVPAVGSICPGGLPVLLSATGSAIASNGPDSAATGTISVTIPDATAAGISSPLVLSGVPAGATITGLAVRFNINMSFDGDLSINLAAPNGNVLNLVNRRGGSGDNFVNTLVSSTGGITFASSSAPFTNTYSADAALSAGSTTQPSNTASWTDLYSLLSGTWSLVLRDHAGGDIGTLTSWTLIVDYTYNPSVSWTPLSGLYTDAGATIPYTGADTTQVYALPDTSTAYTVSLSLGACTNTLVVPVNRVSPADAGTIQGPNSVCLGSTATYTDTAIGGTWISTNPAVATISSTGFVNGLSLGSTTLLYILTNPCGTDTVTKVVTVDVFPVIAPVTGPNVVCVASSIVLADIYPIGTWTTTTGNATAATGGIITGVSAGPDTVIYTIANGCGTLVEYYPITVNPLPFAGSITGLSNVCVAATILATDPAPGGMWMTSNANATVDASGIITGVASGTSTIWYIVNNSCGADTASLPITVGPGPATGVITGPSNVCVGSSISLSDTATGGTWVSSNGNATVSSTGIVTGVTTGIDTISYEIAGACGTAAATKIITIDALPNAGTISGPSTVCMSAPTTFTDTALGGVWTISNTAVATVTTGGTVTANSLGSVLFSYTVSTVCGTATATKFISVNPAPQAYAISGGGSYCSGGLGFAISLSGSQTGVTYQLYNGTTTSGSPLTGTGTAISYGYRTAGGTYTVIATNTATGCTNTMTGAAIIVVDPTTPPSVGISASIDTVCTGNLVTYTAVPVSGGSAPSYVWRVNGTVVSSGPTYSYVPVNGDAVKVSITGSPCSIPDTASSSLTVDVFDYFMPSVSVTVAPGTTVCEGSSATFTAIPTLGGTSPFFRWTKNGVNVATGPTYTYVPVSGDEVFCYMASNYPCRLADTVISSKVTMSTKPVVTPTVRITATPGLSVNRGQEVTLTAGVSGAGSLPTYQWYVNKTLVPGATNNRYTSSMFSNRDTATVVVTSSSVCKETASQYVILNVGTVGMNEINTAIQVSVLPNPNKGDFTVRGSLGINADNEVTLEVTDMLGQSVYTNRVIAKSGNIETSISLSNTLANGMYILSVRSDVGSKIFHIVVER